MNCPMSAPVSACTNKIRNTSNPTAPVRSANRQHARAGSHADARDAEGRDGDRYATGLRPLDAQGRRFHRRALAAQTPCRFSPRETLDRGAAPRHSGKPLARRHGARGAFACASALFRGWARPRDGRRQGEADRLLLPDELLGVSRNAGKRAMTLGYTHIYWYPGAPTHGSKRGIR